MASPSARHVSGLHNEKYRNYRTTIMEIEKYRVVIVLHDYKLHQSFCSIPHILYSFDTAQRPLVLGLPVLHVV